jgi:hypothetical protein
MNAKDFMKIAIENADTKISLITLNQKQLSAALTQTITAFLAQKDTSIIFIVLTKEGMDTANAFIEKKQKIILIDAFSKEEPKNDLTYMINNPSDLTNIQIAIEKAEHSLPGKKIILFDALNVFSIYLKNEIIGKFIHRFANKILLEEKTAILFTIKESTDPDLLETLKEFPSKNYDFSSTFISEINLNE